MLKLRSLKLAIAEIFEQHELPCLWYSGGSDSRLLLEVMLEVDKPFGILTFGDGWTKEQRRYVDSVIIEKGLKVFSYPANAHVLVGENGEMALVSQYAIDRHGNTAILVKDLIDSDDAKRCAFDINLESAKSRPAPIEYDLHIWGTRKEDRGNFINHGELLMGDETTWQVGAKTFITPLAEFSREEVLDGLKTYGIDWQTPTDEQDLGNLTACSRCLKGTGEYALCLKIETYIPMKEWDGAGNLEKVREILGVKRWDSHNS